MADTCTMADNGMTTPQGNPQGNPQGELAERRTFGAMLRAYREGKSVQQRDLATRIDKSASLLSLIESDQRLPTLTFIKSVSEALDLSPGEERNLLRTAGYTQDETISALNTLLNDLEKKYSLSADDRAMVQQELQTTLTSWGQLFESRQLVVDEHYNRARTKLEEMHHDTTYSSTVRRTARKYLADIYLEMGQLTKANRYAAHAVAGFKHLPKNWARTLQAEAIVSQSMIALREGRYTDASHLIDQSMKLYNQFLIASPTDERQAHLGLARSYKRLAQIALFAGEAEIALSHCLEAEAHFQFRDPKTIPNRDLWLRRINELRAWAFSKLGYFDQSVRLYEASLAECEKVKEVRGITKNKLYLGDAYRRQLQDKLKREGWEKALNPDDRCKIIAEMVRDNSDLLNKAETYYRRALEELQHQENELLVGRCLRNLGIILRLKGSALKGATQEHNQEVEACYIEAQDCLEQALRRENDIGLGRRLPNIYEALAELAWEWGKPEWKTLASYYLDLAIEAQASPLISSSDPAGRKFYTHVNAARELLRKQEAFADTSQSPMLYRNDVTNWRDWIDMTATDNWRNLCEELVATVYDYIKEAQQPHVATSPYDQLWVKNLAHFEARPGSRLLAQNWLSSSLSTSLPAGYSAWYVQSHLDRFQAFRNNLSLPTGTRQPEHDQTQQWAGDVFSASHDLYCRQIVRDQLEKSETTKLITDQVKQARQLLGQYPLTYRIEASRYRLPLAFEIKGSASLLQIPYPLTERFKPKTIGTVDHLCYEIVADEQRGTTDTFHEKKIALLQNLTILFNRLTREAANGTRNQQPTAEWLKMLDENTRNPAATISL